MEEYQTKEENEGKRTASRGTTVGAFAAGASFRLPRTEEAGTKVTGSLDMPSREEAEGETSNFHQELPAVWPLCVRY